MEKFVDSASVNLEGDEPRYQFQSGKGNKCRPKQIHLEIVRAMHGMAVALSLPLSSQSCN